MKLTKLQRHTAYIIMLHEAKDFGCKDSAAKLGFCYMILILFKDITNSFDLLDPFPELKQKEPKQKWDDDGNVLEYWFEKGTESGWAQRIKLLEKCIEETY